MIPWQLIARQRWCELAALEPEPEFRFERTHIWRTYARDADAQACAERLDTFARNMREVGMLAMLEKRMRYIARSVSMRVKIGG